MTDEPVAVQPKRRGRPPKRTPMVSPRVEDAPLRPQTGSRMRAKPNWEDMNPSDENIDRFHIPKTLIPEGMDLQWVSDTVMGQPQPQHRGQFERKGWTPVHQEDFEGRFDGMFMPKGSQGEINNGGLVLCARPIELSQKAKARDKQNAREQVQVKEAALRGGDMPGVNLDSQHPSALRTNRISKTVERIEIPRD